MVLLELLGTPGRSRIIIKGKIMVIIFTSNITITSQTHGLFIYNPFYYLLRRVHPKPTLWME